MKKGRAPDPLDPPPRYTPRRGCGINEGGGKFVKINNQLWVEEIDTLKLNTMKLKCFGLLSLFKRTNFLMKCVLLDINIK